MRALPRTGVRYRRRGRHHPMAYPPLTTQPRCTPTAMSAAHQTGTVPPAGAPLEISTTRAVIRRNRWATQPHAHTHRNTPVVMERSRQTRSRTKPRSTWRTNIPDERWRATTTATPTLLLTPVRNLPVIPGAIFFRVSNTMGLRYTPTAAFYFFLLSFPSLDRESAIPHLF